MFGFHAPRARPGPGVLARAINRPAEEVARLARSRPGGAISEIELAGSGYQFSTSRKSWLVRITAVGTSGQAGTYSWQAIAPVPGNANSYVDITGWSGTIGQDALFEDNGNTALLIGLKVPVHRDYHSGQVRTQFDSC